MIWAARLLTIACTLPCLLGVGRCLPSSEQETEATPSTPESAAPATTKSQLTLGVWNIKWLNATPGKGTVKRSSADYRRLQQYAATLNADVIALAEVDGPEAAARVFAPSDYSFHFAGRGIQRTGFAYRTGLAVTPHPDLDELAVGGLRPGADISLTTEAGRIRLLAVHLKSGCFRGPLGPGKACRKLKNQVPVIEEWMEARLKEEVPFVVMGDFNRALFAQSTDPIWNDWNDASPVGFSLSSPTQGRSPQCWDAKYPDFIDHFLLGPRLSLRLEAKSFKEHLYGSEGKAYRQQLSDHCALTIQLSVPLKFKAPSLSAAANTPAVPESPPPHTPSGPIKGNVSRNGRKLYHRPDCPSYKETRIDKEKGEALFATVEQAEANGFTLAGNCAELPPRTTLPPHPKQ